MNTKHDYKGAIAKIQNLNPSAMVFSRVYKLISSPNVQLEQVEDIIKLDTALTANIIRLSNSGLLSGAMSTVCLRDALSRLGLAEISRFLHLTISHSIFYRHLKYYRLSAYDFWSDSVSTAILMELLSQRVTDDKSEAYTLGMLHAVGKLVINQVLEDLGTSSYWDQQSLVETWEIELVGFTSFTAGALLLKAWGLPQVICDTIENQCSLAKSPNPTKMLKMLNFCIRLLGRTGVDFSFEEWSFNESDPFLREFTISLEELKKMVQEAKQKHREAQAILGISN